MCCLEPKSSRLWDPFVWGWWEQGEEEWAGSWSCSSHRTGESGEENELRKADIRKNRNISTFNSQNRVLLHVSWTGLCRDEHKHSIVPNTFTHIIWPHWGGHSLSKYPPHYWVPRSVVHGAWSLNFVISNSTVIFTKVYLVFQTRLQAMLAWHSQCPHINSQGLVMYT